MSGPTRIRFLNQSQALDELMEFLTDTTHRMSEPTKITVLHGHTTPDTAYLVSDYPYGFRLRCKIRYWLEYKKGHGHRLVSQTTNPKVAGEIWNKPKGNTYCDGPSVLFLDEHGHVHSDGIRCYSGPDQFARFRALYGAQLTDPERAALDKSEAFSRKVSPVSWAEWDAKQRNGAA